MTRHFWSRSVALAATLFLIVGSQARAVDYANIDVADGAAPTNSTPPTVTIPAGQSTTAGANSEGFFIDAGSVVGEIPVRIGASAANDFANGVLMVAPRETARLPVDGPSATLGLTATASIVTDADITSENTRNVAGGLAIVTDRAGSNNVNAAYPNGGPMNSNIAAAYFPFSQGWAGGTAFASVNNGTFDTFVGSAGFQLGDQASPQPGDNVIPNFFRAPGELFDPGNPAHVGDHLVKIPGVTDSRRQGILLATHAKNEDNYTMVMATNDGVGYNVTTHDNALNGSDAESKPFSFVFVPLGTPNITMGSIYGSAGPTLDPAPTISSGSNFSLTRVTSPALVNGNYRLTIDGESPSSGVLIVQGGGTFDGDGGNPGDNVVSYRPDGDGWVIVSDDLPTVNHAAGQAMDPLDREIYFDFVFLPFDAPAAGPGAIPALNWTKSSVVAVDTLVTETDGTINGTATAHGMDVDINGGTTGVTFKALRQNRGDNSLHFDGAIAAAADGVMLATTSEGLRDNSATGGGASEFGVTTVSLTGSPGAWEVHSHKASPAGNEEFNVNFAMVMFGADSGFTTGANVPTDASGNGHLDLNLAGVNSETDGVLMVTPDGNFARVATVAAKAGGSGWDVDVKYTSLDVPGFPGNPPTTVPAGVNYVYLPYDTENLVAGRVNADGSIINSTGVGTDPGEFTLTKSGTGDYLLTVAGRTPDQGMLLLNAAAGADSLTDNTMAYEPDGNSFRIFGIDMITLDERDILGMFTTFEDTAFSFAFIDYVTPPEAPGGAFLEADFNQNGVVDGADLTAWRTGFGSGTTKAQGDADTDGDVDGSDFLVWQRQVGTVPPAAAVAGAVPEPGALALALCAAIGLAGAVRRKA